MIDAALLVAEIRRQAPSAEPPPGMEVTHRMLGASAPNLRLVLLDAQGRVLQDSAGELPPGTDRSNFRDIRSALQGDYGSRWEHDPARKAVILFSTVPVIHGGQVSGLVSVAKTTADVRKSIVRSLLDLAVPALIALLLAGLVAYALSTYLTRLLAGLAGRAERVARGEPGVRLETWSKSEIGDLARVLETMRSKIEGKQYIEEMAATLSHELKTPVAAIRGSAEILQETEDPRARAKFLESILAECARLAAIASNFLALSRIESAPQATDARSALGGVAAEVAAVFRGRNDGHVFDVAIDREDCLVKVPEDQLRRLIEALLENAFQFTPDGGRVVLRTRGAQLVVSDEGPGIPAGLQAKVFDRFFTTVNPLTGRRGTGLGLAIVRSIASRCGATIRLQSAEDHGTQISVDFTENS